MEKPLELVNQLHTEDNISVDELTEIFRTLRNACVGNPDIQSQLGNQENMLKDVNNVIEKGPNEGDSDQWALCLRICFQFLGNFIVKNPENQQKVWANCSSLLKKMIQEKDKKLTCICLMILYNIILGVPHLINDFVDDEELIITICTAGAEGSEYAQFIIERMFEEKVDWSKIYNSSIPINGRLFLLETMQSEKARLPTPLICLLATHFRKQSDCILRTVADQVNTLEPEEVSQMLRVLASRSPHPRHLETLQEDRNFFINCAFLLKSIHMAGKEQSNCFSPVAKLSEAGDQLNEHPAFEFKANLVRLLGNLCYQHKENQDMMRDLEIIPVLLDCCNIDARNPFIIQWVVLAVRNLCEANPANQSVIAGLNREGVVQSSMLTEFGLTLNDDGGNKLNVVPLRSSTDR